MLLNEVCHIYSKNQHLIVFPVLFHDRHVPSYEKMFIHVHKVVNNASFLTFPVHTWDNCLSHSHSIQTKTLLYLVNLSARSKLVSHIHSHTYTSLALHKCCTLDIYRKSICTPTFSSYMLFTLYSLSYG